MIFAVLNLSGNTCKTTNTQSFLLPRIPNCDVIRIETVNNDGLSEGEKVTGKDWEAIQEMIYLNDNVILDIGSSNIVPFMDSVKKDKGSHDAIDYFIVPTVPEEKQIADTASTIEMLIGLGIEPSKIRLIFNKVDEDGSSETEFAALINSCSDIGLDIKSVPRLEYTNMFELLSKTKKTMVSCINDENDYKSLLKEESKAAISARKAGDTEAQKMHRSKISKLTIRQSVRNIANRQSELYDIEFQKLNVDFD